MTEHGAEQDPRQAQAAEGDTRQTPEPDGDDSSALVDEALTLIDDHEEVVSEDGRSVRQIGRAHV